MKARINNIRKCPLLLGVSGLIRNRKLPPISVGFKRNIQVSFLAFSQESAGRGLCFIIYEKKAGKVR